MAIDHYNVYQDGTKVTESTDLSEVISNLSPDTTYEYTVTAVSSDGAESPIATAATATTEGGENGQGIQVYDGNNWYWEYNGSPTLLLGGSSDDSQFQWTGSDLTSELDLLVSVGGNYIRNTMSDRDSNAVYAFHQRSDGLYDLSQWNSEYWSRLDNFLQETLDRDIIVQLTLWDPHDWNSTDEWDVHPWASENNVNYDRSQFEDARSFFDVTNRGDHPMLYTPPALEDLSAVRQYQDAFVDKILSHSFQYPHVLYNIENETNAPIEWQDYWANFIQNAAASAGTTAYVTSMVSGKTREYNRIATNNSLYQFVDTSQNSLKVAENLHRRNLEARSFVMRDNNRKPFNCVKIYDTGEQPVHKFWACYFSGVVAIRHHRDQGKWGIGLSQSAQEQIQNVRRIEAEMTDPYALVPPDQNVLDDPDTSILSNRTDARIWVLQEKGQQYVVGFMRGGETDIDLSDVSGTYSGRWLDADNNQWAGSETISAGTTNHLVAPGSGIWVLALTRE